MTAIEDEFLARPITDFEKPFKEAFDAIIADEYHNDTLSNTGFRKIYFSALDLGDIEENGSPERQEEWRQRRLRELKYGAYLLRYDLDRVFYCHPYPRPISERLKKVWPLAEYLYIDADPNGFLGPSFGEMIYVLKAIQMSAVLGNHDFDDILAKFSPKGYPAFFDGTYELDDPDFTAWEKTTEFFFMFENRGPHPNVSYNRMWTGDKDDAAAVGQQFKAIEQDLITRFEHERTSH